MGGVVLTPGGEEKAGRATTEVRGGDLDEQGQLAGVVRHAQCYLCSSPSFSSQE